MDVGFFKESAHCSINHKSSSYVKTLHHLHNLKKLTPITNWTKILITCTIQLFLSVFKKG